MFTMFLLYALILFLIYQFALNKEYSWSFDLHEIKDLRNANKFFTLLMKIGGNNYKASKELMEYKFYKGLVLSLIEAKRSYGAPIDKALSEIKRSIGKDMHFEKKIVSSFVGGLYQMAVISFTGFLFILMSCQQLGIPFPVEVFLVATSMNLLGVLIYVVLAIYLKRRSFGFLEAIVKSCYLLRAYLRCQMPVVQAISKVNLSKVESCTDKKNAFIKERIDNMLQRIKTQGFLDFDEFDMQIEELWLLTEFKFESFQKHLGALKLVIMVFFFLSAYLYVIYSFLSQINI